jgi:hypothetical protein
MYSLRSINSVHDNYYGSEGVYEKPTTFLYSVFIYHVKSVNWMTTISSLSQVTCCFPSAAGYLELPDIFKLGFVTALINALIWGVVGTFWWKFLGLY